MIQHRFRRAPGLSWALVAAACLWPALALAQQASPAADLAARVARLEQSLNNRGLLDLLAEIESLKRELSSLKGELENQAYLLDQQRRAQAAGYADLDARLLAATGRASAASAVVAPPPLAILPAAPTDAVAGAPAPEGNLQVETETPPPPPGASPPAIDASLPPQAPAPGMDGSTAPGLPTAPLQAPPAMGDMTPPAPGMDGSTAPGLPPAMGGLTPPPSAAPEAQEATYQSAFNLLKAGEYDQAIAAFENFQQLYPGSPYGDNAQFWLAEAHYVKRDFATALPAYQAMLVAYPASKKLSHAMLKIGYSHAELGQIAEARAVLTDLQQRFPGSAAAQLAAQRLAQLPAASP